MGVIWQQSQWLWALLPLWMAAIVLMAMWRRKWRRIRSALGDAAVATLLPDVRQAPFIWRNLLYTVGLSCMVVALARPQWGFHYQALPQKGSRIMLVVDVSESMLAQDLTPNRLERARRALYDLTQVLAGDQMGLVAFAGVSFLLCPPTSDYQAVRLYLDMLDPQLIPVQGTDLAAALSVALNAFHEATAPNAPRDTRAIVVITDGDDHSETLDAVLDDARDKGVRIFTVGVGSPDGAPIPEAGGFKKDKAGNVVISRLDTAGLLRIAERTGGRFIRNEGEVLNLTGLYRTAIHGVLAEEALAVKEKRVYHERYMWPLAAGLFLIAVAPVYGFWRRERRALVSVGLVLGALGIWGGGMGLLGAAEATEPSPQERALIDRLPRHPEEPELLYNAGNFYYGEGRYDEAQASYNQALNRLPLASPLARQTLLNLSNTLYRKAEVPQAIETLEKLLSVAPDDRVAALNLAYMKRQQQNPGESPPPPPTADKPDQSSSAAEGKNEKKEPGESSESKNSDDQAQPDSDATDSPSPDEAGEKPDAQTAPAEEAMSPAARDAQERQRRAKRWLEAVPENGADILGHQIRKRLPQDDRTPEKDW